METSLLKSDIFFFVTTIVVLVVGALLTVGILYIVSILKIIKSIIEKAKYGADVVVDGIEEAKNNMKEEGYVLGSLLDIFKRVAGQKKKKVKK